MEKNPQKRGNEARMKGEEATQLIEEKEHEEHCKCMQNLHGLIALIKTFPTIGALHVV
jgi:hypothetical protein